MNAFFSSDGRDIITPERLEKEILNYVDERGGRINIHSLPTIMNVDKSHVDHILQKYVYSNQLDYLYIQDEFISNHYLDNIAEEINDLLQERGAITVSFLAQRYLLPHFFILSIVKKNMDIKINGFFNGEHLYTSLFKERIRSIIKGILLATTFPTPIHDILSNVQSLIDVNFSKKQLFELCQEREVKGKIDTRKNGIEVYVPNIYSKSRHKWIEDIFLKNGYITYQNLYELDVSNPSGYMQKYFPDVTALEDMFITKSFIEDKIRNIEYEIENYGISSISKALDLNCDSQDYKFLSKEILKSIETDYAIINDDILASNKLIKRTLSLVESHIEHTSSYDPNKLLNYDKDDFATLIKSWIPALNQDEQSNIIIEYLMPKFNEILSNFSSSSTTVIESKRSEMLISFQNDLIPLYHNILYFSESIESIDDKDANLKLDQYIKSTLGQDLFHFCIKRLSCLYFIEENNEEIIVNRLPLNISKILNDMKRSLSKNDDSFFNNIESLMKECKIEAENLTDKIRAKIFKTHSKSTILLLDKTKDITKRFQLVISLLYSRITKRFLYFSTKHLSIIMNDLKRKLNDNNYDILSESYTILLEYLKAKKEGNNTKREKKEKEIEKNLKIIESIK